MYEGKTIAVVVPAFNEEKLIGATIDGIPEIVDKIYVIDDGSTDATGNIIKSLGKSRVESVLHRNNRGVGAAIISGYKLSLQDGVDITAIMAGDNQMDPDLLPSLLDPIIDGKADYTKGDRLSKLKLTKTMSRWRLFGNFTLTLLTRIACGYWHITDPQNGYTAISKKALQTLDLNQVYTRYGYPNDMLVKLCVSGLRVLDVQMPARYHEEKSKIRYGSYIPKVSILLLRLFFWRMSVTYFHKEKRADVEKQLGDSVEV